MGIFSSFKGQMGRDAGRVVSNLIWKDKHASVYRRAESRKSEKLKLQKEQFEAEQNWREQSTIEDKIQQLMMFEISDDKNELVNTLCHLATLLKANKYKDVLSHETEEKNKLNNAYVDAIVAKYEQVFVVYSTNYPNDSMIKYYSSILKSVKKLKYVRKYMILVIPILCFIVLGIIGLISSLFS